MGANENYMELLREKERGYRSLAIKTKNTERSTHKPRGSNREKETNGK